MAERVVEAHGRLCRLDEGHLEPRLVKVALPFLIFAFIAGVSLPLFAPTAPAWLTIALPQAIFVAGAIALGVLVWRR